MVFWNRFLYVPTNVGNLTSGSSTFGLPDGSFGKESTYNVGNPGLIPGLGRSSGEGIGCPFQYSQTSLVTQLVRNLPALWQIDPAPGFDPQIQKIPWRRQRLPLQYSGLENSMDCIVYGVTESDTTEWLSLSLSSIFSKTSLYIWKLSLHILLKPSLKNFERSIASIWNELNCMVVCAFLGIALLCNWNKNWPVAPAEFSKFADNLSAAL